MSDVLDLVVLGAGGHGREVADVAHACIAAGQRLRLRGLVDDDPRLHGRTLCDLPVLGPIQWLRAHGGEGLAVVSGVGAPVVRRRVVERVASWGLPFVRLIHPNAILTRHVELGVGVVITAGCIITNTITIGDHAHLNRRVTVGHDAHVGDWVHLAPGSTLSGAATVGDGTEVGTHACVLPGISVGAWSIVGAGAVVHEALPDNVTAVGVPARIISRREPGWSAP